MMDDNNENIKIENEENMIILSKNIDFLKFIFSKILFFEFNEKNNLIFINFNKINILNDLKSGLEKIKDKIFINYTNNTIQLVEEIKIHTNFDKNYEFIGYYHENISLNYLYNLFLCLKEKKFVFKFIKFDLFEVKI